MTRDHDHDPVHRYDLAGVRTRRAASDVIRAVLAGDTEAAAAATLGAGCQVCLELTIARRAIGLAAEVCGETGWPVSEELRLRMLRAIEAAERELGAALS